jgi:hypothetical protein
MPDERLAAGLLLVLGPVLALIPVGYPPLIRIWMAPREVHLATVAAHRRAWAMLNAGFGTATISTASGLTLLREAGSATGMRPWLEVVPVGYVMGGVLWLAVLAIRTRTTPLVADDSGIGALAESDRMLGAATGGLFAAFTVITSVTLIVLGAGVATGGSPLAIAVGAVATLVAAIALVSQLRTGDSIPAVLYVPSLVVGVAVLAGWI